MDSFQCDICEEELADPRMLPCGHSFCFSCLKQLKVLACPQCKKPFENLDALPPNFLVKKWIEENVAKNGVKTRVHLCANCPPDNPLPATLWCETCSGTYLCGGCGQSLHAPRAMQHHTVLTLKEKSQRPSFTKCSKHFQDKVFYCGSCKELVCNVCVLDDHSSPSHTTMSVFKFAENLKNGLKDNIKKIAETKSPLEQVEVKLAEVIKIKAEKIARAEEELRLMKVELEQKKNQRTEILQGSADVVVGELALLKAVEDMSIMDLLDAPSLQLMQGRIDETHRRFQDLVPPWDALPLTWDPAHCGPSWQINGDVVQASTGGGVLATNKIDRTKEAIFQVKLLAVNSLVSVGVAFRDTPRSTWSSYGFGARGWGWAFGTVWPNVGGYFGTNATGIVSTNPHVPMDPGTVIEVKLTPDGVLHFQRDGVLIGSHPSPVVGDGDVYPAIMLHTGGKCQILTK